MTDPIRVLQVFASLDMGGAESMIMNNYRHLDRSVIQFDFVVNNPSSEHARYAFEKEIISLGGRVFYVPRFNGLNILSYLRSWFSLLKSHPEWSVVHGHHTSPGALYLGLARSMGRHTVAHSHTGGFDKDLRSRLKVLARFPLRYVARSLFACSIDAAKWMFGSHWRRARLMKNAIDVNRFEFSPEQRELFRHNLGFKEELIVSNVARFSKTKNHVFLLEVFHALLQSRPDAILLLVGDGLLRSEIEERCRQLGIDERVRFLGVRDDVPDILHASDLFLFPSLYEGLPCVLVEAQASGLPCVVSDRVTREVDATGLVSFVSLEESPEAWAEVMLSMSPISDRHIVKGHIISKGYDVRGASRELADFYLNASGAC
ncbi:glycosyltransferase family 1 protein [Ectothiorhodospira shaposhnikovii]|uniref:glycosyltransferase family 1 protein n=1 Tax=Ectothiorhodospira shaposhnikovii TaxID=1054 RepID=UPI001EE7C4DE|nr:glycosyltransferase family 1 protein [Ectothiorhodospira shaposhnikovii]MCG5512747.1 glycosyltransferase family 1 protein [Ectothiorhodospira shaposhnikovii]